MTALQIYLVGQIGYISFACFFVSLITIVLAGSMAMQKEPTKATDMFSFAMTIVAVLFFATAILLPTPHSLNQMFAAANQDNPSPVKDTTNEQVKK